MSTDNSTNLKKGSGISLLPATWAQIDTWVNIASSAKANGPRITRGDVVGEMAAFLASCGWRPGVGISRPAKSRK